MYSVEKILLPVDFSDRSRGAARYATALAARVGSQITLLHVVEPPYVMGWAEGSGSVFTENRVAQALEQLEAFLPEQFDGIPVQRLVAEGDPAQKIVEFAQADEAGLILMPTHGYGPLRRFLLGSVTAKVLHDADCPVWTGTHMQEAPESREVVLDHILCAVDLGPQSVRTLCWANRMAKQFGARLTLAHIVPDLVARGTYFDPNFQAQMESWAQERLQKLQQTVGSQAELHVERGEPPKALRFVAEKRGADLLVIGRSSEAGVFGRLRANAYAIIRQAPCPVVSV